MEKRTEMRTAKLGKGIFTIISNRLIARNTYEMILKGNTSSIKKPGQFINIALKDFICVVYFSM